MNQTKQMEVLVKVGKKVKSHLVKVELIVLTIFIISMIMKFNSDSTIMGIPLMIGSLCLAFLYFILAFSNAGDNKIERVFSFMSYWALSIAVIGCMFVLEALPGGFIQVQVGGFLLMFVFIIGLFFRGKFKLENFLTKQMIVRVFLVVVATAFLILLLLIHYEQ